MTPAPLFLALAADEVPSDFLRLNFIVLMLLTIYRDINNYLAVFVLGGETSCRCTTNFNFEHRLSIEHRCMTIDAQESIVIVIARSNTVKILANTLLQHNRFGPLSRHFTTSLPPRKYRALSATATMDHGPYNRYMAAAYDVRLTTDRIAAAAGPLYPYYARSAELWLRRSAGFLSTIIYRRCSLMRATDGHTKRIGARGETAMR